MVTMYWSYRLRSITLPTDCSMGLNIQQPLLLNDDCSMGILKVATHYLFILVMLRYLRKFCLNTAFSAIYLTIASSTVEAATLLRNTSPSSFSLDDRSLNYSNYDLNWSLSIEKIDREDNTSTQQDNSLSAQTINRDLKQRYQDKKLDIDTENTISLAKANKLTRSLDSKLDLINNTSNPISENNISSVNNIPIILGVFTFLVAASVFSVSFLEKKLVAADGSLNSDFLGISRKLKISDESVFLHNRLMQEIQRLAARLQQLDDDKFTEAEFLRLLRWESNLTQGKNEYKDLKEPIQLLQVGLDTKNIFLSLEQTEFRYRGSGQQEFYNYITELLAENFNKDDFRSEVDNKLMEILPILMTEEGKKALISYSQELYKLAETNLALKLMFLFRKNEFQNYSILKSISDIIEKTSGENLLDPKIISSSVIFYYDDFEKVSKIIGLSQQQSTVENYTKILQYLGLFYRHQQDYYNFQDFISALQQWQKPYQSLTHIRQQYNAREYDLPKEFVQLVPGEKIAKKYYEYT
jgi:hypothetical protein